MAQYRKDSLANDEYYHIFSRSIAKYIVFNNDQEYSRILDLINILRFRNFNYHYSQYKRFDNDRQNMIIKKLKLENDILVDITAYCIMPTHFHLILKQNKNNGITKYMGKLLNSYSKYFNTNHKRIGPLWSGRFKNIKVQDDNQLLHLTRYIHLNPCSANLVNRPKYWNYSSYKEYINPDINFIKNICQYKNIINLDSKQYKKFVENRKDYYQKLSQIKHLLIDNYIG